MNWVVLKSAYAFVCPWLKVRKDHIKQPSGLELEDFYVIEASDWVNVIAITEDGLFIIEEQYRYGIKQVCYELPAGNVSGRETPLEAAQRELLEETGYAGGEWTAYGHYVPNASGMNNVCYTFLAKNVKKVSEPNREESEDIIIHLMEFSQLEEFLVSGKIVEAVMQAPLWRFLMEKKLTNKQ